MNGLLLFFELNPTFSLTLKCFFPEKAVVFNLNSFGGLAAMLESDQRTTGMHSLVRQTGW